MEKGRGHMMKRGRGRNSGGRRPNNNSNNNGNNANRNLESNGPDVKVRGTAHQICEKYQALARDAHASGDRVAHESYLQHAEHYHRIILASQPAPKPEAPAVAEKDVEVVEIAEEDAVQPEAVAAKPEPSEDDGPRAPRARRGRRTRTNGRTTKSETPTEEAAEAAPAAAAKSASNGASDEAEASAESA